jgi:hypothetical protein
MQIRMMHEEKRGANGGQKENAKPSKFQGKCFFGGSEKLKNLCLVDNR